MRHLKQDSNKIPPSSPTIDSLEFKIRGRGLQPVERGVRGT